MDNRSQNKHHSAYIDSTTKRCLDIIVCLILLLPTVLVLLIILPIILIIDGWPVLFFQKRIGRNGKEFIIPKIRTLKKYAHPNKPTYSYDIKIFATKTGNFLRKYRIDELPQIFSVLTGKMSFVGPRPELPAVTKYYSTKEIKRLGVRPGITGLWQIKASRSQPIHENIGYDLYYLKKANLWFDLWILAKTIPFVLNTENELFYEKNRLHTYNLSMSK